MAGWGDGFSREDFSGSAGILPASCPHPAVAACRRRAGRMSALPGFRTAAESVVQPAPVMTGSRNAERLPEAPNATPFVLSVA